MNYEQLWMTLETLLPWRHVGDRLSAYALGELEEHGRRSVEEHLSRCKKCSHELVLVREGIQLAGRIKQITAPDSIWERIQSELTAQDSQTSGTRAAGFKSSGKPVRVRQRIAVALGTVAMLAVVIMTYYYLRDEKKTELQSLNQDLLPLTQGVRELRNKFLTATIPYRQELWHYTLALTGSPWRAEAVVQEATARAFTGLAYLGQSIEPRRYLFASATRVWLTHVREYGSHLSLESESGQRTSATGVKSAPNRSDLGVRALNSAIGLLVQVYGFAPAEVAAMVDLSEETIVSVVAKGITSPPEPSFDVASGKYAVLLQSADPTISQLVRDYVGAYNRRDPNALSKLFATHAGNEIIGDWEELGIESIKQSSLVHWQQDPDSLWVEPGIYWGRPVLFGFRYVPNVGKVLTEIVQLTVDKEKIVEQKWYYYTPEFIEFAAKNLGVPARPSGYSFDFSHQ